MLHLNSNNIICSMIENVIKKTHVSVFNIKKPGIHVNVHVHAGCSKYTYSTTTYFLSDLSACTTCRCVLHLHDMVFNRGELHHF